MKEFLKTQFKLIIVFGVILFILLTVYLLGTFVQPIQNLFTYEQLVSVRSILLTLVSSIVLMSGYSITISYNHYQNNLILEEEKKKRDEDIRYSRQPYLLIEPSENDKVSLSTSVVYFRSPFDRKVEDSFFAENMKYDDYLPSSTCFLSNEQLNTISNNYFYCFWLDITNVGLGIMMSLKFKSNIMFRYVFTFKNDNWIKNTVKINEKKNVLVIFNTSFEINGLDPFWFDISYSDFAKHEYKNRYLISFPDANKSKSYLGINIKDSNGNTIVYNPKVVTGKIDIIS